MAYAARTIAELAKTHTDAERIVAMVDLARRLFTLATQSSSTFYLTLEAEIMIDDLAILTDMSVAQLREMSGVVNREATK